MEDAHKKLLEKRWLHSHEEDTETERVYRPVEFPFPPSRGRSGFELHSDQTCQRVGIGPTDGTVESDATWEVQGDHVVLTSKADSTEERLAVSSVEEDRLVIRKDR